MTYAPAVRAPEIARSGRQPKGGVLQLCRVWLRRSRARRELNDLTPEQLRDVGLDPLQVRREAAKPFWSVWAPSEPMISQGTGGEPIGKSVTCTVCHRNRR